MQISVNNWCFWQYRDAQDTDEAFWPAAMAAAARAGVTAWEPGVAGPDQLADNAAWAMAAGLDMPSAYVGVQLHDPRTARAGFTHLMDCARAAADCGVELLVVNADPSDWGPPVAKTDPELELQAELLADAGSAVRDLGLTLALHWHRPEFLNGGTEAHYMMAATTAEQLSLCLDVHWTWASCGNSNVAVRTALLEYHDRIVSLHLRQSIGGTATRALCAGDVDYDPVAQQLADRSPLLVIEQAPGPGIPAGDEMTGPLAESVAWTRATFARWDD